MNVNTDTSPDVTPYSAKHEYRTFVLNRTRHREWEERRSRQTQRCSHSMYYFLILVLSYTLLDNIFGTEYRRQGIQEEEAAASQPTQL